MLHPPILAPTCISKRSKTLIGSIFSSFFNAEIHTVNLVSSFSDHLPQFAIITKQRVKSDYSLNFITERDFRNFSEEKFLNDIANINWGNIVSTIQNANKSLEAFIKTVNNILDLNAPLVEKRSNSHEIKRKPWLTKGLLWSINSYYKFIKTKNQHEKEILFEQYKSYKNCLAMLLRNAKDTYYKSFFRENKKNVIKIWRGIKEIINYNVKSKVPISYVKRQGKTITDTQKIADYFNDFFSKIAHNIDKKIVPTYRLFN